MTPARQLVEQSLGFLQIARVEPLRKPPVNRSQQFARFSHLALVAPEACEAHGGAEFPGYPLPVPQPGNPHKRAAAMEGEPP